MTLSEKRCQSILAAVGCLVTLATSSSLAQSEQPPDRIAASVNGEAITAEHLEEATRSRIEQVNNQLEQFKRSMLDRLINNLLLQQAARAEGLTIDDYLKDKVESVTVSQDEVEGAYEKSKERFPGMLESEVKYRIRRQLEDNRRAAELRQLLSKLRRAAEVRNYFLERPENIVDLQPQAGPSLGPPGARVTIVEFSDFECPFCRRVQPILRRVLERWPKQVRLVYKHLPLERHRNAFGAAKAAVCADRQGRFWDYHDALFRDKQDLSPRGLVSVAEAQGLELGPFEACLRAKETGAAVETDRALARRARVTGTPMLFVNGRRLSSPSQLESEIEALLSAGPQPIAE